MNRICSARCARTTASLESAHTYA